MAKLKIIRTMPQYQRFEDLLGAVSLFVLLYAGLTLTGTA